MALTDKQEKFVLCVIAGMSQRQAYKEAYNTKSMSNKTIDEAASRLLADRKVAARYDELHSRIIKEAEDEAIISAKEVLRGIAGIARDDISNYLDFRGEVTQVDEDCDGNPVLGYKTIVDIKDSKTIDTKNISEISIGRDGQFKFKTYCRDTALYKLADILGLSKSNTGPSDTRADDNLFDAIGEAVKK